MSPRTSVASFALCPLSPPEEAGAQAGLHQESFRTLQRWPRSMPAEGGGASGPGLGQPFSQRQSPSAAPAGKESAAFPPSLVCAWHVAVLVNCGRFTIEALSHGNGCG